MSGDRLLVAGALLADSVWFHFGRRRGKRALQFLCRIALEPDSCVRQTENAFVKYGVRSLLVAKFVPGLQCGGRAAGRQFRRRAWRGFSGSTLGRVDLDASPTAVWDTPSATSFETVAPIRHANGLGPDRWLSPFWRRGFSENSSSGSASSKAERWRASLRRNCATSMDAGEDLYDRRSANRLDDHAIPSPARSASPPRNWPNGKTRSRATATSSCSAVDRTKPPAPVRRCS